MALPIGKTRAIELPFVSSIAEYRFSTTIDGTAYIFEVHWNTRDFSWYFHVREIDGKPIAYGIRIVLGAYLGRRYNHRLFRDGVMVAGDRSGKSREATFNDLGTRVIVQWIPVLQLALRLDLPT